MKKVLGFIGSAAYGFVAAYLLWLAFYFLTPWLMSFGWLAVILYWIFAFGLIGGIIGGAATFVFMPLFKMSENNTIATIIPICCLLFFGYSSIMLPWRLDIDYTLVKIIIAVSISFTALCLFISLSIMIYSNSIKD